MLRAVSEGLVGLLLDPADYAHPAARPVVREVLSGAVLRPLMMWCTPYDFNRGIYALLGGAARERERGAGLSGSESMEVTPETAAARSEELRGHWLFEQRLL